MGGNAVSSPQQKFCQELHYLLTKNSYETPLKEVEDLAKEIAEICPCFPLAGMLDLKKWDKIGYCLREQPKVNFKVRHTWFQVRACLREPTPSNPLLAEQYLSPLPIILPPKPASWQIVAPKAAAPPPVDTAMPAFQSAPPPACPALEFPNQLPDPEPLPEPSPALSTTNDGKLLSAGFVDTVSAAALDMESVHPSSPVLRATAPAQAEKSAQIHYEALKELHRSIRNNEPAPYTHSLLEILALQKLLPTDWQTIIRNCLTPTEAMLCLQGMLRGEDAYAKDTALSGVAEIVLKAWSRIPAKSDSNVDGLAAIRQGAKELFAEFVDCLIVAVEEQMGTKEAQLLTKKLAFENSNGERKPLGNEDGDDGGGGAEEVKEMWNSNRDEGEKSRLKQGPPSWGEAASMHPPWETPCLPSSWKGLILADTVAMVLPCLDSPACSHPLTVVLA